MQIINLPRIPLKDLYISNGDFAFTYEHIRVKISIIDDLKDHESCAESGNISPSFTEFMNSRWIRKWDTVWNLDYINEYKIDIEQHLKYYFVYRNILNIVGDSDHWLFQFYKIFRKWIGAPLYFILKRKNLYR